MVNRMLLTKNPHCFSSCPLLETRYLQWYPRLWQRSAHLNFLKNITDVHNVLTFVIKKKQPDKNYSIRLNFEFLSRIQSYQDWLSARALVNQVKDYSLWSHSLNEGVNVIYRRPLYLTPVINESFQI